MATVQWSGVGSPITGKYIGSAFTTNGNNPTLQRNPTAANKLRPEQYGRRWAWSRAQRFYKQLNPTQLAELTICGQNNPHVNSRHEVVNANRYHKYLQIAVYEFEISGTLPPTINSSPAPSVDYVVTAFELRRVGVFDDGTQDLEVRLSGTLTGSGSDDAAAYVYISRPVGDGVVSYSGSWVFMVTANLQNGFQFLTRTGNWWAKEYAPNQRIFVRIDVIDFTRGFVITSQMFTTIIT